MIIKFKSKFGDILTAIPGVCITIFFICDSFVMHQATFGLLAFLAFCLFFYLYVVYGVFVVRSDLLIDENGMSRIIFGKSRKEVAWEDIELIREYSFNTQYEKEPRRCIHVIKKHPWKKPYFFRKFIIYEIFDKPVEHKLDQYKQFEPMIQMIDFYVQSRIVKFELKEHVSLPWRESTRQQWLDYNANWLNIKEKFYKKK